MGTIVIHNIQQLHNYFLFIWTMVLCLDNEFNRISKLYDSMESLQALTVHHWIKPALRYFKPNFLSTTVICFRLTPANNSDCLFIFLGPFNMLGLDLLLLKDTSLQLRFLHFFCSFDTVPSSILNFRFHAVYFFDNSENCFFFIVAMNSSKQVLRLQIVFLSSTRHIMIL